MAFFSLRLLMYKKSTQIIATRAMIATIVERELVEVVLELGVPTAINVPENADAGITATTVSGWAKDVATDTQLFPFQYSTTLAAVKFGFEMLRVTRTSELKGPLLETMETS